MNKICLVFNRCTRYAACPNCDALDLYSIYIYSCIQINTLVKLCIVIYSCTQTALYPNCSVPFCIWSIFQKLSDTNVLFSFSSSIRMFLFLYPNCRVPELLCSIFTFRLNLLKSSQLRTQNRSIARLWKVIYCCTQIVMDSNCGVADLHSSWFTIIVMYPIWIGTEFPQVGRACGASLCVPFLLCTLFVYWPFLTWQDKTRRDKTTRIISVEDSTWQWKDKNEL